MARLSNYVNLVAFFMATIIVTISAAEEESLDQCGKHIGSHCGKQVIDNMLSHDHMPIVSTECCYKLFQTGYHCHTKLTLYLLQTRPELKNANWTDVLARSDEVFHKCDLFTKPAGSPEILAKCMEILGSDCGEQLVKMGQACHVDMVKDLIRTPEMRDVNAIQLLSKNKKIFHCCVHVE
ncbi:hypothetical protein CR513_21974, partial [Mucuna pruriens]